MELMQMPIEQGSRARKSTLTAAMVSSTGVSSSLKPRSTQRSMQSTPSRLSWPAICSLTRSKPERMSNHARWHLCIGLGREEKCVRHRWAATLTADLTTNDDAGGLKCQGAGGNHAQLQNEGCG